MMGFIKKFAKIIFALVFVILAFTIWSLTSDKRRVAKYCSMAKVGTDVETIISIVKENGFRIVVGGAVKEGLPVVFVPSGGLGRHQCHITHKEGKVTGAEAVFMD